MMDADAHADSDADGGADADAADDDHDVDADDHDGGALDAAFAAADGYDFGGGASGVAAAPDDAGMA